MNIKLSDKDKQRIKDGEKLFLLQEGTKQFTIIAKDREKAESSAQLWNAVVIKEIKKYNLI